MVAGSCSDSFVEKDSEAMFKFSQKKNNNQPVFSAEGVRKSCGFTDMSFHLTVRMLKQYLQRLLGGRGLSHTQQCSEAISASCAQK